MHRLTTSALLYFKSLYLGCFLACLWKVKKEKVVSDLLTLEIKRIKSVFCRLLSHWSFIKGCKYELYGRFRSGWFWILYDYTASVVLELCSNDFHLSATVLYASLYSTVYWVLLDSQWPGQLLRRIYCNTVPVLNGTVPATTGTLPNFTVLSVWKIQYSTPSYRTAGSCWVVLLYRTVPYCMSKIRSWRTGQPTSKVVMSALTTTLASSL